MQDRENYLKMAQPFESADAANEAWSAFARDVAAARQKHKITNCLIVVSFDVVYESGVGSVVTNGMMGDSTQKEILAAFALGQARAEQREYINGILAGKNTQCLKEDGNAG